MADTETLEEQQTESMKEAAETLARILDLAQERGILRLHANLAQINRNTERSAFSLDDLVKKASEGSNPTTKSILGPDGKPISTVTIINPNARQDSIALDNIRDDLETQRQNLKDFALSSDDYYSDSMAEQRLMSHNSDEMVRLTNHLLNIIRKGEIEASEFREEQRKAMKGGAFTTEKKGAGKGGKDAADAKKPGWMEVIANSLGLGDMLPLLNGVRNIFRKPTTTVPPTAGKGPLKPGAKPPVAANTKGPVNPTKPLTPANTKGPVNPTKPLTPANTKGPVNPAKPALEPANTKPAAPPAKPAAPATPAPKPVTPTAPAAPPATPAPPPPAPRPAPAPKPSATKAAKESILEIFNKSKSTIKNIFKSPSLAAAKSTLKKIPGFGAALAAVIEGMNYFDQKDTIDKATDLSQEEKALLHEYNLASSEARFGASVAGTVGGATIGNLVFPVFGGVLGGAIGEMFGSSVGDAVVKKAFKPKFEALQKKQKGNLSPLAMQFAIEAGADTNMAKEVTRPDGTVEIIPPKDAGVIRRTISVENEDGSTTEKEITFQVDRNKSREANVAAYTQWVEDNGGIENNADEYNAGLEKLDKDLKILEKVKPAEAPKSADAPKPPAGDLESAKKFAHLSSYNLGKKTANDVSKALTEGKAGYSAKAAFGHTGMGEKTLPTHAIAILNRLEWMAKSKEDKDAIRADIDRFETFFGTCIRNKLTPTVKAEYGDDKSLKSMSLVTPDGKNSISLSGETIAYINRAIKDANERGTKARDERHAKAVAEFKALPLAEKERRIDEEAQNFGKAPKWMQDIVDEEKNSAKALAPVEAATKVAPETPPVPTAEIKGIAPSANNAQAAQLSGQTATDQTRATQQAAAGNTTTVVKGGDTTINNVGTGAQSKPVASARPAGMGNPTGSAVAGK